MTLWLLIRILDSVIFQTKTIWTLHQTAVLDPSLVIPKLTVSGAPSAARPSLTALLSVSLMLPRITVKILTQIYSSSANGPAALILIQSTTIGTTTTISINSAMDTPRPAWPGLSRACLAKVVIRPAPQLENSNVQTNFYPSLTRVNSCPSSWPENRAAAPPVKRITSHMDQHGLTDRGIGGTLKAPTTPLNA